MKKFVATTVFLAITLVFGHKGVAQDLELLGKLTPTDNSVTKVMSNAGCDFDWLSEVLSDSNIRVSQLRSLPVGQEISLGAGKCKTTPQGYTVSLSRLILNGDLRREADGIFSFEVTQLQGEIKKLESAREAELSEVSRLREEVRKLGATRSVQPTAQVTNTIDVPLFMAALLGGILIGGLSVHFTQPWWNKDKLVLPLEVDMKESGRTYTFKLFSANEEIVGSGRIVGRYKCPLCSENNILGREANLRRHLVRHLEAEGVRATATVSS